MQPSNAGKVIIHHTMAFDSLQNCWKNQMFTCPRPKMYLGQWHFRACSTERRRMNCPHHSSIEGVSKVLWVLFFSLLPLFCIFSSVLKDFGYSYMWKIFETAEVLSIGVHLVFGRAYLIAMNASMIIKLMHDVPEHWGKRCDADPSSDHTQHLVLVMVLGRRSVRSVY